MSKSKIILIVVAVVVAAVVFISYIFPMSALFIGTLWDSGIDTKADIEIDSYRICKDKDGNEAIIIRYLLKNKGKEPTSLLYEGDFNVYQNGVGLTEVYEDEEGIPKDWKYDTEDQYKNVKDGVEYYAEIAYWLEDSKNDVEVEVYDYSFFGGKKKEKVFKIK